MSFTPHNIGAMEIRNNDIETEIPSSAEYVKIDSSVWQEVKTSNMEFKEDELVVQNYGDYMVTVSASASVSTSDVNLEFVIASNGDVVAHSSLTTHFSSVEVQQIGLNSLAELEEGDKISLKVKNNSNDTNVLIEDALLRAVRI